MLNFSSLRQQVSDRFLWVVPLGIAVVMHILWLAIGARTDGDVSVRTDPSQAEGTVVDNTAQLVRLTRRAVQQQTLPSVGLDLSGTLPPPPPELIEDVVLPEPPDARADCPPEAQTSQPTGTRRTPNPAGTLKADSNQPISPASPLTSATNTGSMPDDDSNSSETDQERVEVDDATLNRNWSKAMGVPIWPDVLGPKQTNVELRELPLSAFNGRSVQDLHQSEFTTSLGRFRLSVDGQRVFLIMELSNP